MSRPLVLVYRDFGCDVTATRVLFHALHSFSFDVAHVCAEEICRGRLLKSDVMAVCFPGGEATPYRDRLQDVGIRALRDYVDRGGRYLGVCAGAYFACQDVLFEVGTSVEKKASPGVSFFQGAAFGALRSLAGPYDQTAFCANVVDVLWGDYLRFQAPVYYFAGPAFVPYEGAASFSVLARYQDGPDQSIAALSTSFGRGRVVLVGPHVEFSFEDFMGGALYALSSVREGSDVFHRVRMFKERLQAGEESRAAFWSFLVHQLVG